ncbi:universal stress protein [Leeuwenhoekiella parthenopeia]|uniref:Universal stress protein n=1 Tax=Leeuwenhoekiella parthenopeia TaxID=2890320 RepID=A0ABS8GVB3_9FLAO|nr:universal stress protein [Leeuwenhoekiella parthenopeia]MCC4213965.1 universal stress protein [Leeuwenhoekiella parthenopeia]
MKRILLPTDFSKNAYNAIEYAVQLFEQEACEFSLLHTYSPLIVPAHPVLDSYSVLKMQKMAQENAEKNLEDLVDKITNRFNNQKHSFQTHASFNLLTEEMKNCVQEKSIDLVVMGTQGATGAKEIFLGTETMDAIKKMKCPVLAVPEGFTYENPREILFPTDFELDTSNKYLSLLRYICETHGSRIHMLNAYYGNPLSVSQEERKQFLDNFFIENVHLFHIAENTEVIAAIEQFQLKHKINLLVMVHNKHNLLENILFRPIINQVAYHTHVPFLVIPSVERQ